VSVSAIDEEYHKENVKPIKLDAFDSGEIGDGNSESGSEEESKQLGSYLTTPNLLAVGLAIVALFLLLAIFKSRGSNQRRSKDWELQEATWGLQNQNEAGWDNVPKGTPAPPPAAAVSQAQSSDIYATTNRVQSDSYGRTVYQSQQPVLQPVRNDALLDDLIEKPAQQPQQNIDTSFLDDLL
jgi:type II secretory pathway pseudopilin PulG